MKQAKKTVTARAVEAEIINAVEAVEDVIRPVERIERWIEAIPEAISRVSDCQAMKDGTLLPIPTLEKIDGRKIETIVLAILKARFIDDEEGNSDYTHDEAYVPAYRMMQRAVNDAQFAILHLVDFGAYVTPSLADKFYYRFYRRGDESVQTVAKRAIKAVLAH